MVNILIGFWFFFSLPGQARPMSGTLGTLFICAQVPALALVFAALFLGWKKLVRPTAWTLLAAVVFMTFVREVARAAALSPWFSVTELEVVPQYSPFIAFLLVFAAGLWMVWYMLRLVTRDKEVQP